MCIELLADVAITYYHLGNVHSKKDELDHAVALLKKANAVIARLGLSDRNLVVRSILRSMAECQTKIWHSVRSSVNPTIRRKIN